MAGAIPSPLVMWPAHVRVLARHLPLQNWMCSCRGLGLCCTLSPLAKGLWSGTPKASSVLLTQSQTALPCISLVSYQGSPWTSAPGQWASCHPFCPAWGRSEPQLLYVRVFPSQNLAPATTTLSWARRRGPIFLCGRGTSAFTVLWCLQHPC